MPSPQTDPSRWTEIYNRQADTVYRVCYSFMKNRPDTRSMVQKTFRHLQSAGKQFETQAQETAWLIVTASYLCRIALKTRGKQQENPELEKMDPVLQAIVQLPDDCKTVVYLYYYEGCSIQEIAAMLNCPEAAVRSRLQGAKKVLQTSGGGAQS